MNTLNTQANDIDASSLIVRNIKKAFKQRVVLNDVSLELGQGEVVALLGPNGAGKTTCFYSIVGLIRPDAGTVLIGGRDVTQLPMYRRAQLGIGYLPQEASIFRGMNVEDNILSILEIWEPNKAEQKIKLEQLLEEFSIGYIRKSPALALSGGERRRVEIARCLASSPKFVLLDEPFAGVDPIAISDIRDLVATLKNRNIGVLITDHNVRETLEIVDRAYILHGGKVLMSGTPKEVISDPNVRNVYLGSTFKI
ncbi:MAG: LPS export ABC transporter ATP-binding protein [Proteobacteria bacterium]|nr:LPS export ABC transporter ATP-binding protein [Pseudomonadota bacterium]